MDGFGFAADVGLGAAAGGGGFLATAGFCGGGEFGFCPGTGGFFFVTTGGGAFFRFGFTVGARFRPVGTFTDFAFACSPNP